MNDLTFALGFLASTILFDIAIFAFIYLPDRRTEKKLKKQISDSLSKLSKTN